MLSRCSRPSLFGIPELSCFFVLFFSKYTLEKLKDGVSCFSVHYRQKGVFSESGNEQTNLNIHKTYL